MWRKLKAGISDLRCACPKDVSVLSLLLPERLDLVLVTFREENANPQHLSDPCPEKPWFHEIVAIGSEHLGQCLRTCK
jgi:hypothetical protein